MHIAVLFSLLGTLAGLGRVGMSAAKGAFSGPAPLLVALMTVICLFFTVLAVRSFVAARKAREAQG